MIAHGPNSLINSNSNKFPHLLLYKEHLIGWLDDYSVFCNTTAPIIPWKLLHADICTTPVQCICRFGLEFWKEVSSSHIDRTDPETQRFCVKEMLDGWWTTTWIDFGAFEASNHVNSFLSVECEKLSICHWEWSNLVMTYEHHLKVKIVENISVWLFYLRMEIKHYLSSFRYTNELLLL